ncbi:MAG: hypothetical protein IJR30_01405 [Prevotella sp.]|nr:hypothetical protein [Prevotella sp.]
MNKRHQWMFTAILLCCGMGILSSCNGGKALKDIHGTLEEPIVCQMPDSIRQALDKTIKVHCFEIMSDSANSICVSGIGELDNGVSTLGYGMTVVKNATTTTFPDIRNSRQPQAYYDKNADCLWLSSCVMEGTGVNVEQLYKLQFGTADDSARVVMAIEPYQMQQQLISQLKYTIEGEKITFHADGVEITTAENTVKDMGGLDEEQPVWIGEQISYMLDDGQLRVCFVPGIKFTTGLVLTYDDMPTLSAGITIQEDGSFSLSDFKVEPEQ